MMKYTSKEVRDSLGRIGIKNISRIKEMNS